MTKNYCRQFWSNIQRQVSHVQLRQASLLLFSGLFLVLMFPLASFAQDKTVTGVITDSENGDLIAGATVIVKNKKTSAMTDMQGVFKIKASEGDVLMITNIGYKAFEVAVDFSSSMQIKMTSTNRQLNEVVVVGYGTKKRSDITGSVASVPKARLEKLPVTNILHAIEGSVAGVSVTQFSSVPGSSADVLVRGKNSISANSGPLL